MERHRFALNDSDANGEPLRRPEDDGMTAMELALSGSRPRAGATILLDDDDIDAIVASSVIDRLSEEPIDQVFRDRVRAAAPRVALLSGWRPSVDPDPSSRDDLLRLYVRSLPLESRIAQARILLESGRLAELVDQALIQVRDDLHWGVRLEAGEAIAVIESTARLAPEIASVHARIVIAVNPARRWRGASHRTVHIRQSELGQVDLEAVRLSLAWPTQPGRRMAVTTLDSPRDRDCEIPMDKLVATVARHIGG